MPVGSPFVHPFTVQRKLYYFHSLTLEVYTSPEDCPDCSSEDILLSGLRDEACMDRGIVMGTLFLTTACPRSCSYCFLQGVPPGDMTTGEIDISLEIIGSGPADLLLYGGEPLLRPDLISHTVKRLRDSGADINLVVATGGCAVDEALAADLASANAFMIVSMDGPPDVHNGIRPMKGNSFLSAESTFHLLRSAGCRAGISVTLSRANIDDAPGSFLWLMDHFQPDDMGLNPWLHPLKGGVSNPWQISVEEAVSAVTTCMETAIDRGMYIEQLARRVRPFVNRTPRLKDCASSGGRLVVIPGGRAGTCDCMTVCGDHGVSLSDIPGLRGLMKTFRPLAPVNFPGCLGCPALGLCGGGCRYDALHSSGDLRGKRDERCEFERRFLQWMLKRSVEAGRDSLIPFGGFDHRAMPMPVGTMLAEGQSVSP